MSIISASGAMDLVGSGWQPPDEFDEFRIVRSLGVGAMGQVYLAHDLVLERPVAVKFVLAARDPQARARILEEARAIARLQHPNVVAIYRVADLDGHPYLVSEYVPGRALHQLERPMPWRRVLDIALDLTRGLAAAHRRGVLHRDVKPANAILDTEGRAKLLDFGLAKLIDRRPPDEFAATPAATVESTSPGSVAPRPIGDASARASANAGYPQLVGTPMYMAPEVWVGEPASRRSDLYSLGVVLYELLTGAAPHRDVAISALPTVVQERDAPPVLDAAPGVEPALAAIVDRLVRRDPAARFASADALLLALEERAAPAALDGDPDDNPYRGLAVYESAHASLFFGRRGEIRELVDRVATEAFVVVGGDSGTGKSSLCRAGVLPSLARHDGWSSVEVVPGRHPMQALATALAPWTGSDEAALAIQLRDNPDAVARGIRQRIVAGARLGRRAAPEPAPGADRPRPPPAKRRLLLFVDQLEELLTLSELDEARAVATALAALAVRSSSVHVLTTARSDFLSRLAMLPGLGDEFARGLYFLPPLSGEHMREVIVRPAALKGVGYESDALIDSLVAQTEHAPGGLPLLQFTLAELWDARDRAARTIRAESLTALGGVGGALTRHADRVLAGLGADERDAARRILLRLVTAQGTRTRRREAELVVGTGGEGNAERTALEVLVRGRVLVANNAQNGAYEIAHEALLTNWPTLQAWLQRGAVDRAMLERVEQAAEAWQRMSRRRDLLWGSRQLAEARSLDRAALPPREAAFLASSTTALRRLRALAAGAAAVLVVAALIVGLALRARARRELEAVVSDQTRAALAAETEARKIAVQRDVARKHAFELFDTRHWADGETAWAEVEAMASREERQYRTAAGHLDSALLLDPSRPGLRSWAADLSFERLVRAERDRRADLIDELAARLATYRDSRRRRDAGASAELALTAVPDGTAISIERPGSPRYRIGESPLGTLTLPPGSVVIAFDAPGRVSARLPILLARDEALAIRVELPAAAGAPRDMIYVPPGRFLFGSGDGSDFRRGFLRAAPLHEVSTAGYYIGRHEVTFGEWIEFLDDLAPDERRRRTPSAASGESGFALGELGPHQWRLTLKPTSRTYTADTGQRLHYEHRTLRADQDWTRFPVAGISYNDAIAFAEWLDRTHRIPGARLCDEHEWERAARGADGRTFPSGATLAADDANIDVTYGRDPLAFGPDEVGSHPGSRSPVGADDMAGSVWEWARSAETADAPITRGGCWYQEELGARSMNRSHTEPTQRHPFIGVRLCATPH
jgi:eukaryotic-like serine/threonine-protein kinase